MGDSDDVVLHDRLKIDMRCEFPYMISFSARIMDTLSIYLRPRGGGTYFFEFTLTLVDDPI